MMIARAFNWVRILLIALILLAVPAASFGHVGVSITIAPPVLLVYSQPVCPGEGYLWTPGYWAWGDDGYYWVPGTWVLAPEPGFLWTPGYWGWGDGIYIWHAGYWGPHVGFYGGINYGFGYVGVGYAGGYWHGGHFFYNREVNNVHVTVIHNTYNKTVINTTSNRVSFNGGRGGTTARPTSAEMAVARERHVGATSAQARQQREASTSRAQFASVNHGRPDVVATAKPGEFKGEGAISARGSASSHVTPSRTTESPRTNRTNNNATSSRATESSRSAHTNNNNAAEHRNTARSENKTFTPPNREKNVKPKSAPPHTEARPTQQQAPPPAQHQSAPRPAETQRAPHTEARPAQHQAPPPAQHQSAPRPAETQRAPRAEAGPAQHQAPPPAQHESAPREEKKSPRG
jgi:YXWGXW repeat-containing protein